MNIGLLLVLLCSFLISRAAAFNYKRWTNRLLHRFPAPIPDSPPYDPARATYSGFSPASIEKITIAYSRAEAYSPDCWSGLGCTELELRFGSIHKLISDYLAETLAATSYLGFAQHSEIRSRVEHALRHLDNSKTLIAHLMIIYADYCIGFDVTTVAHFEDVLHKKIGYMKEKSFAVVTYIFDLEWNRERYWYLHSKLQAEYGLIDLTKHTAAPAIPNQSQENLDELGSLFLRNFKDELLDELTEWINFHPPLNKISRDFITKYRPRYSFANDPDLDAFFVEDAGVIIDILEEKYQEDLEEESTVDSGISSSYRFEIGMRYDGDGKDW